VTILHGDTIHGSRVASCSSSSDTSSTSSDRIARCGGYFVSRLVFKELKSHYRMDLITNANPETVKCLIWIAILTLMCSRRILRLIRNANPENANRYTPLRWAEVFTEQADRLLTEVLECVGLKLEPICSLYTTFTSAPNVKRERLMDRWIT